MRRFIRVLGLSVLTVGICWGVWQSTARAPALAEPQATITIAQPDGVDDVVGNGDDFATTVFGDPWDMSQPTDILALHSMPDSKIEHGVLTYTIGSLSSDVPLLWPGFEGVMDVGRIGVNYPINTDHYRWLSFRIKQPGGCIQIRWHYAKSFDPYAMTGCLSTPTGSWQTYVVDLETVPMGSGSWQGQVVGLYIVSSGTQGAQVQIDWVRLTANNPADNSVLVSWLGLNPEGSTVRFHLDPDGTDCDGPLIHTEWSAPASGSFAWWQPESGGPSPVNVLPGDYYVCAKIGSDVIYSPGRLTINQAPVIQFTQPS
jgi:hypothetical protein